MITIVLPDTVRTKKNHKRPIYVKRKGDPTGKGKLKLIPSNAYLSWERMARTEAIIDLRRKYNIYAPIEHLVSVKATIYYKGPRPDLQGCFESIADCLEGILWVNDKQIESWDGSRIYHTKTDPRTVVQMEEFKDGKLPKDL